jgi:hypothetical protein
MKRYSITAKPWDYRSADLKVVESDTGEWVAASSVTDLQKDLDEALRLLSIARSAMWGTVEKKIETLLRKYGK